MGNMIKVGMADLKVCKCPDALTTLGLGSCVGVALYDPVTKVSGLLHCMLPDSTQIRNNSNVAKFADTGIDELIRQMENLGASKSTPPDPAVHAPCIGPSRDMRSPTA